MEKINTPINNNDLSLLLKEIFGDNNFTPNKDLSLWVKLYQETMGNRKKMEADHIFMWFLDNGAKQMNKQEFYEKYDKFMQTLDKGKTEVNEQILESLNIKLFRQKENNLKAQFIIQHSDITPEILSIANQVSNLNPYHNFGHQLGVAETALKLAQFQKFSKSEINVLVLASLFHDAQHDTTLDPNAEEKAYETAIQHLPKEVFQKLGIEKSDFHRLIIATKLTQRGQGEDQLTKTIQDADLGGLGRGPYYLLYATMGRLEENKIHIEEFINSEESFINKMKEIDNSFFLSEGGKKILIDPTESLQTIKNRPKETIQESYRLRKEDMTFNEFIEKIATYIPSNFTS